MKLSGSGLSRYAKPGRYLAVGLVLVVLSAWRCGVNFQDFAGGIAKGLVVVTFFFPPEWSALPRMIEPALVTVVLAAVATPLGTGFSLFFGLAAANNIAPPWLRAISRLLIAIERGLPEIITLLLLVAAFGIGPLPGILALAIGSIGMLAKLLADAIEEIDMRVFDSVSAVGATRWQVIRYAVLPEVMPALIGNSIFRYEVNIRHSVLLGAVGAGGIGYELQTAMSQLEYDRATVAVGVSLLLVFVTERTSDLLRRRLMAAQGGLR
jgi:phosphonate transport system permease protein